MNDLETELREIWRKYELQRKSAAEVSRQLDLAENELTELNTRRAKIGLPHVGLAYQNTAQYQSYAQNMAMMQNTNRPKTWLEGMDAELLAAVKRWIA